MSYSFIADLDKFATDDIMDPIAKAKMVALKGIKRVLAQDPMGGPPGINRYFFCVNIIYKCWTASFILCSTFSSTFSISIHKSK